MASYRDVFLTQLAADATLSSLLTGGFYDSNSLPTERITAKNVPGVWTGKTSTTLKPFAAVTWREESTPNASFPHDRRFAEVYIYGNDGYSVINDVVDRLKAMFHGQAAYRITTADDAQVVAITYVNASEDYTEPNMANKPARYARLQVDIYRKVT